jgi:hypothetical protein
LFPVSLQSVQNGLRGRKKTGGLCAQEDAENSNRAQTELNGDFVTAAFIN